MSIINKPLDRLQTTPICYVISLIIAADIELTRKLTTMLLVPILPSLKGGRHSSPAYPSDYDFLADAFSNIGIELVPHVFLRLGVSMVLNPKKPCN